VRILSFVFFQNPNSPKFKNQDLTPTYQLPEEVKQNPALKLEIMSKPAIEDGYLYVASKKSEVFHNITCEHVASIKEENLLYFHSLEEAEKSERRGCKNCKPEE